MRKKLLIGGTAAVLTLALAAVAMAVTTTTFEQTLTAKKPKKSTGTSITVAFDGGADRPDALRRAVFTLPPGFRYDNKGAVKCLVPEFSNTVTAKENCPAKSRIGDGEAEGVAADGSAIAVDVEVYNLKQRFLFELSVGGTVASGFTALSKGRKLDVGPLDDFPGDIRITRFVANINASFTGRRKNRVNLITTGPCPKNKVWKSTARFTFAGGQTSSKNDTNPCTR